MTGRATVTQARLGAAGAGRRATAPFDLEVVTFRLADALYGLELAALREVIRVVPIAELPRVPAFVLGIATRRGVVVPILDLRLRLGLAAPPPGRAARILIAAVAGEPVGLLVDAVAGVVRLVRDQIAPGPPGGGPIAGRAHAPAGVIALLAPDALARGWP